MGHKLPGFETGRSVTPREILYSPEGVQYKPGGIVVDGTKSKDGANTNYTFELRAGWAMGQITASGKYCPCKRTQVNGTSGSVQAVVVDNAAPFVVGDVVTIGSDTGNTLTAVDYTTNTLTWVGAITVADNDAVFCEDGSGICRGFLPEWTRLRNIDNDAAEDQSASLLTAGRLNKAMLLGDIDAIIATLSSHFLNQIEIWSSDVRVA